MFDRVTVAEKAWTVGASAGARTRFFLDHNERTMRLFPWITSFDTITIRTRPHKSHSTACRSSSFCGGWAAIQATECAADVGAHLNPQLAASSSTCAFLLILPPSEPDCCL